MNVSLIISTFNRAHLLAPSLERIAALTRPDEIIVVDDGGDDDTSGVCDRAGSSYGLNIRYVYNDNPGVTICSLARNIGLRMAEHEYVMTSEPELVWVTDVVAQFRADNICYPGDVVSAGHIYFLPHGLVTDLGLIEEDPPPHTQEAIGWVAPHTALYRKDWLMEVGGWDEGFPGPWGWDDTDLLTRLRFNGHGQHIDRDVCAWHQHHGIGGDPGSVNENYWLAKSFHQGDMTDVVANKEIEWGRLRTPNN